MIGIKILKLANVSRSLGIVKLTNGWQNIF